MIKAVIFDLYGTLVRTSESHKTIYRKARHKVFKMIKLRKPYLSYTLFSHIYNLVLNNQLSKIKGTFKEIDLIETYRLLLLKLNTECISKNVYSLVKNFYKREVNSVVFYDDAIYAIRELKRLGYKLGLISNASIRFKFVSERLKFFKYFDILLPSYRWKLVKPHSELFIKALRGLNVKPYEAVMIGDVYTDDILGAKRVGMHGILLVREQDPQKIERIHELINEVGIEPDAIVKNLYDAVKVIKEWSMLR